MVRDKKQNKTKHKVMGLKRVQTAFECGSAGSKAMEQYKRSPCLSEKYG